MFLLPCSHWVPGATPPGAFRLRRRRSSRRHGTRVSPRRSSERRLQVVRTIEACSCSCCSAPSDRDKSDACSPTARRRDQGGPLPTGPPAVTNHFLSATPNGTHRRHG